MTTKPVDHRLETLTRSLADAINLAEECGYHDTARLIAMAQLDLHMRVHAISEPELRAYCSALEGEGPIIQEPSATPLDRKGIFATLDVVGPSGRRARPTSSLERAHRFRSGS